MNKIKQMRIDEVLDRHPSDRLHDKVDDEIEIVYDIQPLADILADGIMDDIGSKVLVRKILNAIPRLKFIEAEVDYGRSIIRY